MGAGEKAMTLELNRVAAQIDDMGREFAGRAGRERQALPAARALLTHFAGEQEMLCQVAESQPGQRLRCASPGDERLDSALPAPALPSHVTLAASDGSQIYPDRHGLAFYYAINIGSIVYCHGSDQAPRVATEPRLRYTDEQIYPGGEPISSDTVGIERNLAEMEVLTGLLLEEAAQGPPCLGLGDGPLLIWLRPGELPEGRRSRILADYLGCLDRLGAAGIPVGGFVSRPHSAEVVALLYLAHLEPEERQAGRSLADTGYRGLTDRALFGFLETGQRSALFVRGTPTNQDFRARGHAIHFFYLNTGSDVARVEIPEWVARQDAQLDLVHAAVYDQCSFNNGYPYILTRADEQAVILAEERRVLEEMLVQAMIRHGLPLPELSRKAQQKKVARWRRHP
jgi:hypothetical protein